MRLFGEYGTLTSATARISPSRCLSPGGLWRKRKIITIKSMRQDRESERERAPETSVESRCHRVDFSAVTDASNDLLACENRTYTWDCLQPSAPLLQTGTEIIKYELQGRRVHKHSCHRVPVAKAIFECWWIQLGMRSNAVDGRWMWSTYSAVTAAMSICACALVYALTCVSTQCITWVLLCYSSALCNASLSWGFIGIF